MYNKKKRIGYPQKILSNSVHSTCQLILVRNLLIHKLQKLEEISLTTFRAHFLGISRGSFRASLFYSLLNFVQIRSFKSMLKVNKCSLQLQYLKLIYLVCKFLQLLTALANPMLGCRVTNSCKI
jgi:hypothetical protein